MATLSRTTSADLTRCMATLVDELRTAGATGTSDLHLEHGSKTYGRAFRLYLRDPQSGGLSSVPGLYADGYLGMTKGEAAHSLDMLAAGVRMARSAAGAL